MDFRDPKVQKIAIAVIAFGVIVYFWYGRVYTKYDNQLNKLTTEYSTMITNLKNVEMKSKSLDALKIEYEDLLTRYQEIEQLLPEVKQIPSFLVQLHTASSLTGTRITKIEPLEVVPEAFYNAASFNIEMTGTYHDFGKFIGYVANFPFIANISEMNLTTTTAANIASSDEQEGVQEIGNKPSLTASFKLSTYYVKADERLQELVL